MIVGSWIQLWHVLEVICPRYHSECRLFCNGYCYLEERMVNSKKHEKAMIVVYHFITLPLRKHWQKLFIQKNKSKDTSWMGSRKEFHVSQEFLIFLAIKRLVNIGHQLKKFCIDSSVLFLLNEFFSERLYLRLFYIWRTFNCILCFGNINCQYLWVQKFAVPLNMLQRCILF